MFERLLPLLTCPDCLPAPPELHGDPVEDALRNARQEPGPDLVLEAVTRRDPESAEILDGTLHCPGCDRRFPVEEGVPTLTPRTTHGSPPCAPPAALGPLAWAQFGDLARESQASDAWAQWAAMLLEHWPTPAPRDAPAGALDTEDGEDAMDGDAGPPTFLDTACGLGRLPLALAAVGRTAVGADACPDTARTARTLARTGRFEARLVEEGELTRPFVLTLPEALAEAGRAVDYVAADPTRLPFKAGAFDGAASCDVLETCRDPRAHFAELLRVGRAQPYRLLAASSFAWDAAVSPPSTWMGGTKSTGISAVYLGKMLNNTLFFIEEERAVWRTWRNAAHCYARVRSWSIVGTR